MSSLRCPSVCAKDFPDERTLARHLAEEELLAGRMLVDAIAKARTNGQQLDVKVAPMVKVKGREGCAFCRKRSKAGLGPCGWHGGEKSGPNLMRDHRRRNTRPVVTGSPNATAVNGLTAQIARLVADVERGKKAEKELAAVRKALGVGK